MKKKTILFVGGISAISCVLTYFTARYGPIAAVCIPPITGTAIAVFIYKYIHTHNLFTTKPGVIYRLRFAGKGEGEEYTYFMFELKQGSKVMSVEVYKADKIRFAEGQKPFENMTYTGLFDDNNVLVLYEDNRNL